MKGIDALVLAAGPPKPDKGGDMPGESSSGAGVRAMRALGSALATKDYGAAYAALQHAVELCQGGHSEPDADESGGPSDADADNMGGGRSKGY